MKKGMLILKGTITLLTPALLGGGQSNFTDMDVILDSDCKPFIPATSLVGVLKDYIADYIAPAECSKEDLNSFWGYSEDDDGRQSALCCSDLVCSNAKVRVRDGIDIDTLTGLVKPTAKYDYQVIEPGAKFNLYMEVLIQGNKENKKDKENALFFRKMLSTILHVLESGNIHVGAKTNNGLGKIKLADYEFFELDFSNPDHVKKWFKWLINKVSKDRNCLPEATPAPLFKKLHPLSSFTIEAKFKLKSSFIIRDYSEVPEAPDAVSIKSADKFVMPGSSLKGAIRSRAERILNTLEKPISIMDDLFGFVEKQNKKKQKGKLRVEETLLPSYPKEPSLPSYKSELQSRIKIDRFTGGTIDGALFETMPLFRDKKGEATFEVKLSIKNYKDYEAGLLLLILKDLWTGDLAVGGEKSIGRGVFDGYSAKIYLPEGPPIALEKNISGLEESKRKKLQSLVEALVNYHNEEGGNEKFNS